MLLMGTNKNPYSSPSNHGTDETVGSEPVRTLYSAWLRDSWRQCLALTLSVAVWALLCGVAIFHNSNISIVGNPKPTFIDIAKMFGSEMLISSLSSHLLMTLIVFALRSKFSSLMFITTLLLVSTPTILFTQRPIARFLDTMGIGGDVPFAFPIIGVCIAWGACLLGPMFQRYLTYPEKREITM